MVRRRVVVEGVKVHLNRGKFMKTMQQMFQS